MPTNMLILELSGRRLIKMYYVILLNMYDCISKSRIDLQHLHRFHQITRCDTTAKMIHEAGISIAGRYKSEKSNKLSTGIKQLRERCLTNEEERHTSKHH